MWPTSLDMTRDECRGMLRRLELESYSTVVSAFRAQGGLSDIKVKLLEDLRSVFHISQDRHRAEARRVANDERLCTIAETISGPNTAQEWNREGRRPFPLLPRSPAFTALAAVANGVGQKASKDNAKLPYPSETARTSRLEDEVISDEAVTSSVSVVKDDPVKVMLEERKNLKRALPFAEHMALTVPEVKKRTVSGSSTHSNAQTPVHTNTRIQQLYHSHSKTQSRHKKGVAKRTTVTAAKSKAATPHSKAAAMAASAHKNASKSAQEPSPSTVAVNKTVVLSPRTLHTYASQPQLTATSYPSSVLSDGNVKLAMIDTETVATKWPQIATSKKDITNNLSKLILPSMPSSSATSPSSSGVVIASTVSGGASSVHQQLSPQVYSTESGGIKNEKIIIQQPKTIEVLKQSPVNDGSPVSWTTKIATIATAPGQRCNIKTNATIVSGHKQIKVQPLTLQSATSSHGVVTAVADSSQLLSPINRTAVVPLTGSTKELFPSTSNVAKLLSPEHHHTLTKLDGSEVKLKVSTVASSTTPQKQIMGKIQTQLGVANKPKFQITSNQILSPAGVKLPTGVQLKGLQRKSVKIYSSPSGKMFIQSADSPKNVAKIGAVVSPKNLLTGVPLTAATAPNRIAVQKLQFVPSGTAGIAGAAGTSGTKTVTLNKNMVLMQTMVNNMVTTTAGNVVIRSLPVVKNNSKTIQLQDTDKILSEVPFTNLVKNQNNVIVIGAVSATDKKVKDNNDDSDNGKILDESSMITEDTPVDILPSPINLDNTTISLNQAQQKDVAASGAQGFDLKSTAVSVVQTVVPATGINTTRKFQLKRDLSPSHPSKDTITIQQQQQQSSSDVDTTNATENNYIISTTDWEMELDQEANKTRDRVEKSFKGGSRHHNQQESAAKRSKTDSDRDEETVDEDSMTNENLATGDDGDAEGEAEGDGDEDVEFDVSYGTQEDLEENTTIEYVEEAPTSSDEMIEIYGEPVTTTGRTTSGTSGSETNGKNQGSTTSSMGRSISQNSQNADSDSSITASEQQQQHQSIVNRKTLNASNKMKNSKNHSTSSGAETIGNAKINRTLSATEASAAAVLYEMQEIDGNGLSKFRNVTIDDLIAAGQTIPSDITENETSSK